MYEFIPLRDVREYAEKIGRVYNYSDEVSRHGTVTGPRKMTTEVAFGPSGSENIYTFMLEKEE